MDTNKKRMAVPPAAPSWPAQVNRERRGHEFYPPQSVHIPALYETDEVPASDKTIVAHYFVAGSHWWIVEADQRTGEAFGYACLNSQEDDAEWGYISLPELESATVSGIWVVERDEDWTPTLTRDAHLPGRAY